MSMNSTKQLISGERLGQILFRADDAAAGLVEQPVFGAKHDDRGATELRIILDKRAGLIAVETRHHDVHKDDRWTLVGNLGQSLETVDGGKHVTAFLLQQGFRRTADRLGVIDNHDLKTGQAIAIYVQVHLTPLRPAPAQVTA